MIYLTSCSPPCEIFGESRRRPATSRACSAADNQAVNYVSIIAELVTLESQMPPPLPAVSNAKFPDRISRNSPETRRTLTRGEFHRAKRRKGERRGKKIGKGGGGKFLVAEVGAKSSEPQPAADRTVLIPPSELPQALPAGLHPSAPPSPSRALKINGTLTFAPGGFAETRDRVSICFGGIFRDPRYRTRGGGGQEGGKEGGRMDGWMVRVGRIIRAARGTATKTAPSPARGARATGAR